MCAITGKITFNNIPIHEIVIAQMNRAVTHRGPDDTGIFINNNKTVGFGHQRLAIIDISEKGHQPMHYLNRYTIVFNGEIYNFKHEKEKLISSGYQFKSDTDTEVIMALYDKYKTDCLKYLRGMFAFALYDDKEQTVFCARDRIGKKPFKYYLDDHIFLFASELKSILTQTEYKKEIDYDAIHHYLTLQYCPQPYTGFKHIKKLEPGSYLFLDLKTKKITQKKYWHLDYSQKLTLSEKEWENRIIDKLEEAVKIRMIGDVPIGAFLSGGIDSSAIVALMAKNSSNQIKTFSVGFEEQKYNELPYARQIAKQYNTDHTEFIMKSNIIEDVPFLVKQYEEPYADSSALPVYHISRLTKKHVTVVLNGDGGDENFAGYPWYSVHKFALYYRLLRHIHNITALPISQILYKINKNEMTEQILRFAKTLKEPYNHQYVNYIAYFTNHMKQDLYTDTFKEKINFNKNDSYRFIADQFIKAQTSDKNDQALYADIHTYLVDDLLVKVDIATMANSIEGRSPFLDHHLLELTAQIPFNLKLKGLNNKKYILKKALEHHNLVPREILYRPKRGFSIPINEWLCTELKDYVYNRLLNGYIIKYNIIAQENIKYLLDTHTQTKQKHGHRIWALLTLELWFEEYFN